MTEKKEYIDRKWFCENFCRCNAAKCAETGFQKRPIFICPTADVQEIKHGKWILRGGWSRCSECDGKALLRDVGGTGGLHEFEQIRSNICPYCGAKMDGKEESKE